MQYLELIYVLLGRYENQLKEYKKPIRLTVGWIAIITEKIQD